MARTLFQAFQESAKRFKNRTALFDQATGLNDTYASLYTLVGDFIAYLQQHCAIVPGQRVALLMGNQREFIIGFMALQALGAVVIPLNYRLTVQEHLDILADAGVTGLVSSLEYREAVKPLLGHLTWYIQAEALEEPFETDCPCYSMADLPPVLSPNWQESLPVVSPHNLAVLIYTSGTTGRSKGVMLNHHNLLQDAWANARVIAATQEDVFITTSPLFHVFGLTNVMLTALDQGAAIVLVRRFNPKSVLEAIGQYKVSFLAAVPTMYQMMLSLLPNPQYFLGSLRVCHSGAAPMHQAVFQQVESTFGAPVQEGYGQSEASSIINSNPLDGVRKPGSIGKPLEGVTLEIVDENDRVTHPGEIGELRVKGDTVMMGYWNNPEASARALRNGWLYTSDMGYRDEDGYIFLAGRRDDLINVGGAKVYPQEVEEVLYRHGDVISCAVVAEPSQLYYQTVAAYVVCHAGVKLTAGALQKFCRTHLAEYKVPKAVYFVDEIPKGATGKILRHQLKPPTSV